MPAKGSKTGVYINCDYCGKQVYQTKTQYNRSKHHYCSNECQKKYQHIQKFEFRKCEICGKNFECNKKSKQRFCSTQCQNKWQTQQTGFLNSKFTGLECQCENCNKTVLMKKKQYKAAKHHFCSDYCRSTWYKNNVYCTDEWREKSKIRAVKILKGNPQMTMTKPQKIVNNLLDSMGILYINEYEFDYYAVDNYLKEYNLIIEVMGDYWHTNPNIYKDVNNINEIQQKRIHKDKTKEKYIKNKYDINILYLWENDIINNSELCKKLIDMYIGKNGCLKNYHSYNYTLSENNDIILNNIIVFPYFQLNDETYKTTNIINA